MKTVLVGMRQNVILTVVVLTFHGITILVMVFLLRSKLYQSLHERELKPSLFCSVVRMHRRPIHTQQSVISSVQKKFRSTAMKSY